MDDKPRSTEKLPFTFYQVNNTYLHSAAEPPPPAPGDSNYSPLREIDYHVNCLLVIAHRILQSRLEDRTTEKTHGGTDVADAYDSLARIESLRVSLSIYNS